MTDRTLTAMYDTRGAAESARDDLVALGIPSADVMVRGGESSSADAGTAAAEDKGFWASLADALFPDDDRETYAEGLRRGGYLLTVRLRDGNEDQVLDVLERHDPIDIDERAATWRQSGWAGYQGGTAGSAGTAQAYTEGTSLIQDQGTAPSAAGTGYQAAYGESTSTSSRDYGTAGSGRTMGERAGDAVSDAAEAVGLKSDDHDERRAGYGTSGSGLGAATVRSGRDGDVVERAEEELRVGKREVGRGGVRVRSYVIERPVEEQVSLREERVHVERRPVDRPVQPGDDVFREKEITATERGEEAVIDKQARVVEEIGIRKDVDTRTETVRDTVRQQEVEIEDSRTATERTAATRDRAYTP